MTQTFTCDGQTFTGDVREDGVEIYAKSGFSAFDTSITSSLDLSKGAYIGNQRYDISILGERAFSTCSFISVIVPSTVLLIKNYGFAYCKTESVIIKSKKCIIGVAVFESAGIKQIDLSNNDIDDFGGQTFWKSEITHIRLPSHLKTIRWYEFSGCTNLNSITFPPTLKVI